jgi:hypothetical protein
MTTNTNLFVVDRCREIAAQAKTYRALLTQTDPISLAIKDEWLWIQVRAQTGAINRVDKRAEAALEAIRERVRGIVKILAEVDRG